MKDQAVNVASKVIPRNSKLWKAARALYFGVQKCAMAAFRRITRSSIFFRESEMAMCSLDHTRKLEKTVELFDPKSALDLGCGVGKSLDWFVGHDIDAHGVEGSTLAISKATHPDRITQHDLNRELDLGRRFDMVWCVEVAEHIHPKFLDAFMSTFANHSDRIVLSAAPPGQEGEGHFNEQPLSYWIEEFGKRGWTYDEPGTLALQAVDEKFSPNMLTVYRES